MDALRPKREIVIFLAINVGASLLLRGLQLVWPSIFFTLPTALIWVALILAANVLRVFYTDGLYRTAYVAISLLNVVTLIFVGNTSFLTSIRAIYQVLQGF